MTDEKKRPCGLYRTTIALGEAVPAGRLVYFHNHGDPGPGVYLPQTWNNNQVVFQQRGATVRDLTYIETLEPLLPEGLYRVVDPFYCCEEHCHHFEPEQLVQLGYDHSARPILFVPELMDQDLVFPTRGTKVEEAVLEKIRALTVRRRSTPAPPVGTLN